MNLDTIAVYVEKDISVITVHLGAQLFNLRICNGCYEKNSSNDLLDRDYLKVEDLNDDTLLLVINGCEKTGVGGYSLGLFPDLEIICNKIMRLFTGISFTVNKDRN